MKTRSSSCWTFRLFGFLVSACALLAGGGCDSTSASKSVQEHAATTGSDSADSHIGVMCIGDLINKPPESFHYSYKYADASGSVNKEADITPKEMNITITDSSGSHSFHGVRSDDVSWNNAVLDLSNLNITKTSATLDSLNDTSAVVRGKSETVNGYQTTKYTIDTTSANSSDKQKFDTLFGKGSFEKGTVWVGPDGCAVQLVLDEGWWQSNGSIKKDHMEISRIKK